MVDAVAPGGLEALAQVELLRALDPEVLERLVQRVRSRTWDTGALLLRQGEPGQSLIVLVSGAVTVYQEVGGERAALAHLTAPLTLGEVTLVDGADRSATVEATRPCEGLELAREDLLALLHDEPVFLDSLLRQLGALVRRLSEQAADSLLLDLPGRVAKTLVVLSGPEGRAVRLSQSRLAELTGGTRQSLNQVLRRFSERGLIQLESGAVRVLDPAALRRRGGLAPTDLEQAVGR